MASRAGGILARIVYFLCGAAAFAVDALYIMLRGSDLPSESEWLIFAVGLGLVGGVSVLAAILPRSWMAKMCRVAPDDGSLRSLPLRVVISLAAAAYLFTVALYLTPHAWNLDGYVWTFLLCPAYIVRTTIDPRPVFLLAVLAPIDAAIYGAAGVALAHGWLVVRGRRQT